MSNIESPLPDFRLLFSAVPGNYLALSPDRTIVAASDAYLTALGTTREALLGCDVNQLFAGAGASLERAAAQRAPDMLERRLFAGRYWSIEHRPVFDAAGGLAYFLHVARDVTIQHKSETLAVMSHELRTPLTVIVGYSEILLEEAEEEGWDGAVYGVGKIQAAGQHLLALINDFLDLSKIESGRMEVSVQPVDLPDLVEDLVAMVQPLARQRGNTLAVMVEPGLDGICADALKLRQSLLNLLSNACKFTENGLIALDVCRLSDNRLVMKVSDTGVGIAPEHQELVFEEFRQLGAAPGDFKAGTGLGLPIARNLARLMGGDLTLASEPGRGSTFSLVLPLQPMEV